MSGQNGTGTKVEDAARDVAADLGEVGRELRQKANDVRKEVVKQLNNAAETIRRETRENTEDANAHKSADEVAKGLEKAAHYLNNNSVEQMEKKATTAVRKNPIPSVLIALGIGFILGLLLSGGSKK
ncbi:MAG: DUF883 C-terminal domain-containing protein [Chloroflexi bacterium]|nr:DUF883 C-terminal domain-containing protein [Chloroflexota bacterium]MCC6895113.1 hypothetical protein [Anaerolineae bacterium]